MIQKILAVLREYALILFLILFLEMVLTFVLFAVFQRVARIKSGLLGVLFVTVLTPMIHHCSHIIPILGFILTSILLAVLYGTLFKKVSPSGAVAEVGMGGGCLIVFVRMLIHYLVIFAGLAIFAWKLFSDLQGALG